MDIKLHGAAKEPKPGLRNEVYLVCCRYGHGPNINWIIGNYDPSYGRSGLFFDDCIGIERDKCIGWLELPTVEED